MSQSARSSATLADFWAIPEGERFHEFIGGELIRRADPSAEHGSAQVGVVRAIAPPYQRRRGSGGPGGWWILTEVEVLLETGEVVRPDVTGYRRESCPERPTGNPIKLRPDWICEIVSQSNAHDDTIKKLRLYHGVGLPHYWILDPRDATLTVMRFGVDGFTTLMRAERHEVVRAEPFEQVEVSVGMLLGDDPPDG
jgi:Uma2 family endonuclease